MKEVPSSAVLKAKAASRPPASPRQASSSGSPASRAGGPAAGGSPRERPAPPPEGQEEQARHAHRGDQRRHRVAPEPERVVGEQQRAAGDQREGGQRGEAAPPRLPAAEGELRERQRHRGREALVGREQGRSRQAAGQRPLRPTRARSDRGAAPLTPPTSAR
jgi:hypothetical protein